MRFVDIDGIRLELQHVPVPAGAAPAAAPLVFLHEGLGSVALWRDWPARLCAATGRAGWVYSRRGYGRSSPVPDVRGAGRLPPDYLHREALHQKITELVDCGGVEILLQGGLNPQLGISW